VIPGSATPVPGPGGSANFSLSQNRPNPFGLDTEIQFSLREVSTVTIAIYDLAGREVAQLVNGEMEGGFYSTRWGGQNRAGELVQRGVYFLRMSARALRDGSRFTATRRMLVM
jgi:flagellar hook assembly protein FlgD